MYRVIRYISIIFSVSLLTGCGLYRKYERPDTISTDNLFGDSVTVNDTVTLASQPWQEMFADSCLQILISSALENNTDIRSAQLRVEQSQAALSMAKLAYYPSVSFNPQGAISSFDGGRATKTYQIPISANWQLDIFGGLTNAKRQSAAQYEQSKDYAQAVRCNIIANVANTYYALLMLDKQLEIAEATEKSWKETLRVMNALKRAGESNEVGISQIEAVCKSVEIAVLDLKEKIKLTENGLCLLLGETPHKIERGSLDAQTIPSDIKIGIPLQLLSNRPDVRMAERGLESAFYATNQARAAFYPNISLSGNAGWSNSAGGLIVNPGKFLASVVGNLVQPIFANGKLRAQLKISKAEQERAALEFQQALLNAGSEVNDALTSLQTASDKTLLYENQIGHLEKAVHDTQLLMKYDHITYLDVLTAQQSLYEAQLNQTANRMSVLQAAVNLYIALGGG